jgi:pilus assembly protein CpaF
MQKERDEKIVSDITKYIIDNLPLAALSDEALEENIEKLLEHRVAGQYFAIERRISIVRQAYSALRGLGPLDNLMYDDSITEIMINGPDKIFVEKKGEVTEIDERFDSQSHLEEIIQRLAKQAGQEGKDSLGEASLAAPLACMFLPDGSRVQMVLPPLARGGPSLAISKYYRTPMTEEALIQSGCVTEEVARQLQTFVEAKYNILLSGAAGAGKTALLNVLSNYIPKGERVITIEDAAELCLEGNHNIVSLERRDGRAPERSPMTLRALIRSSLRMRPDRIIVGEVRGEEALDVLQAMNTGYDGSLSSCCAVSPQDMLSRLEMMAWQGGRLPRETIRQQIASAVDIIIHLSHQRDNSKKIMQIIEVVGCVDEKIRLNPLYVFEEDEKAAPSRVSGRLMRTGNGWVNDFKLRSVTKTDKGVLDEGSDNTVPDTVSDEGPDKTVPDTPDEGPDNTVPDPVPDT